MYDIQLQPFDMASDFMFGERKRASSPLILVLENWWLKKCSSTIQPHTHTYTSIRYCCVSNWDSSSYSLQVHHGPAGAPGGDPPPHPGPHFRSDNHHHTHHLPLPPQADSQSAPAPQRPLHVQEHVVPQPPSPPSQSHHDRRHFLRAPPPPPDLRHLRGLLFQLWTESSIRERPTLNCPSGAFRPSKLDSTGQLGTHKLTAQLDHRKTEKEDIPASAFTIFSVPNPCLLLHLHVLSLWMQP